MIRVLVPMLIVLPLIGAGVSLVFWRQVRLQQVLGVAVVTAALAMSIVTLAQVWHGGPVAVRMGGWDPVVGIVLVADLFSTALLAVSQATVLAVLVFAIGQPRADKGAYYFHPLYLVLAAGVSASFLTADLFNLYVAFEVMLSASYVLLTLSGRREQMQSGITYVVINTLASLVLATSIGLVYAATGALNMAEVAVRLNDISPGVRDALGILLLVTFGIKAAIFPLYFWLPDAYPIAPVTVTAVFAGLLTKVGVYAIIRTQTLLFPSGSEPSPLLLTVAAATMLVGVLGAIAQDDVKRILSFAVISSIGYMVFGLGLSSTAGLAGAILYIVSQIPVKTSLFLVNGMIETVTGTATLHNLGGLIRRIPAAAVLFLLAAASLAGVPPTSGFVGKLALVQAGLGAQAWLLTGVSLVVSALTLFAMTRIYSGAFWGPSPDPLPPPPWGELPTRVPTLMTAATVGLVGVTVLLAVGAGPLWDMSERAADELLNPSGYIRTVLEP